MNDGLDEKLARLGRRIQAQKSDVRRELEAIGALELADECKKRFGARLVYLKTPTTEVGTDPFPGRGCIWTVYQPPKRRKGS